MGNALKPISTKDLGKLKSNTGLAPLKNGGNHYHVALKLTGPKRWKSVEKSITSSEGIVVNFSAEHDNYYSAYWYFCKEDISIHCSKHHPNLGNISFPRTKRSTKAYRNPRKTKSSNNSATLEPPPKKLSNSKSKPKRLSRLEVSEFMVEKNIHRATVLYAAAEERRKQGQIDLTALVLSCTKKLSMILLRAPGKCKMQRLPLKERKHPECRC